MRILFVGIQNSPHIARWIDGVADNGWDLHLFGIDAHLPDPIMRGVTLHLPSPAPAPAPAQTLLKKRLSSLVSMFATDPLRGGRIILRKLQKAPTPEVRPPQMARFATEVFPVHVSEPEGRERFGETDADYQRLYGPVVLADLITRLKPDLIHSMEFQHCGYLVLAARDILGAKGFPPWLATNWGSDIYLFGRQPAHAAMIRRLLAAVDLYSCECHRDVELAREFGFLGPELPVLPNSGGMDLTRIASLRNPTPPSQRKLIMVKGYDHFAGRAMVSLAVLERFADQLKDFEVVMFSVGAKPRVRALELREQRVLNIRVIDWATHEDILAEFGRARMYLGISISDAISTSVLEAMAMGAFPIQTNTSCCQEWFEDGVSGFIIPPDDFEVICDRFGQALENDQLVDNAAMVNRAVVEARLDQNIVQPQVRELYRKALAHVGKLLR